MVVPAPIPPAASAPLEQKEIEVKLGAEDKVDRNLAKGKDDKGNDVRATGEDIKIHTDTQGKVVIDLPVAAGTGSTLKSFDDPKSGTRLSGDTLIKPVKDNSGKAVMDIVIKVEKIETEGPNTKVTVKTMSLKTAEQQQDMSAADPNVGKVGARVEVDLKALPAGASLKVTMDKKADDQTQAAIKQAVSSAGKELKDVAFVMKVEKSVLENAKHLGAATITMKVSSDWVAAQGGAANVKIIRVAEDGEKEVLETKVASSEAGSTTFQGASPKGLSAFALAALAAQPATVIPTPAPDKPKEPTTPDTVIPTPPAAPAPQAPAPEPAPAPAAIVPPPTVPGAITQVIDPAKNMVVELPDMTRIELPAGAMPAKLQMQARAIRAADLPSAPAGKVVKALDIVLFDLQGKPMGPTEMATPITIHIPLSDEDVKLMGNNPLNTRVEYLDPDKAQWETVSATVDLPNKLVNAQVTHMSLFAVVVLEPTAAGDGTGWLIPAIIGALAVAAASILLLIRRRQPAS